jgi:Cys-tRNA(Pro)/Cys-tRNA(Cys) deacylase
MVFAASWFAAYSFCGVLVLRRRWRLAGWWSVGWRIVAGRGTPATIALERAGIPFTVHEYAHDPRNDSYGTEASQALGVSPARMFKTLVVEVDGSLAVGVVPVQGQLDLKALAAACGGKKAAMAQVSAAERVTGYVAGGISPVGQRKRLPVVVDASAMEFGTVFCSGGRRGLEIELAPADLVRAAGATLASIGAPGAGARDPALGMARQLAALTWDPAPGSSLPSPGTLTSFGSHAPRSLREFSMITEALVLAAVPNPSRSWKSCIGSAG